MDNRIIKLHEELRAGLRAYIVDSSIHELLKTLVVLPYDEIAGALEKLPMSTSTAYNPEIENAIIRLLESKGIRYRRAKLGKNEQGRSKLNDDGTKEIIMSPGAGTSSTFHELTHIMFHIGIARRDTSIKQLEREAETVAYCLSRIFGVPSAESVIYLARSLMTPSDIVINARETMGMTLMLTRMLYFVGARAAIPYIGHTTRAELNPVTPEEYSLKTGAEEVLWLAQRAAMLAASRAKK